MRLLDTASAQLDLGRLGMANSDRLLFEGALRMPHGLILVTGPTGSGKTTTLYAGLKHVNSPDVNITTVEDPVEYQIAGINQTQVHPAIGLTFVTALRAFLRQDPNIIMVGEIRDAETAQTAVRAALTGHLVLSTIHTNDAASAVTRMVDMGVEPFLIASTIRLVIAQRLVRRICESCRDDEASSTESARTQPEPKPVGCPTCNHTGYKGRTGVYELLSIRESMIPIIMDRAPAAVLREAARAQGLVTLREAAESLVLAGLTSQEEANRETMV
jgi:general secretion pathway protein E